MRADELQLFAEAIPAGVCLEFGAGGSTAFFFEKAPDVKLYSVEGDGSWLAQVVQRPLLQEKAASGAFFPIHADIGPVGAWSVPQGAASPAWLNYHLHIWSNIPAQEVNFVLVDGRFRVACALQSFLRCGPSTLYLVHDFSERPEYHVILKYSEILRHAGTSVLLSRKPEVDWRVLALDLQVYLFDPD